MKPYPANARPEFPNYTVLEERVHVISHLFGIAIGIGMLIYALIWSNSFYGMISGVVFGVSLVILYLASCTYHGLPIRFPNVKKFFQVVDHCSIFILIAGSSTPFIFCVLGAADSQIGQLYNIGMWGLAVIGIVLLVIDLKRFKKVSILLYLLMGFSLLLKMGILRSGVGETGFALIVASGAAYCIGLVLYSLKIRWTHTAFHVLCIVGSVLLCSCVCRYVI